MTPSRERHELHEFILIIELHSEAAVNAVDGYVFLQHGNRELDSLAVRRASANGADFTAIIAEHFFGADIQVENEIGHDALRQSFRDGELGINSIVSIGGQPRLLAFVVNVCSHDAKLLPHKYGKKFDRGFSVQRS